LEAHQASARFSRGSPASSRTSTRTPAMWSWHSPVSGRRLRPASSAPRTPPRTGCSSGCRRSIAPSWRVRAPTTWAKRRSVGTTCCPASGRTSTVMHEIERLSAGHVRSDHEAW